MDRLLLKLHQRTFIYLIIVFILVSVSISALFFMKDYNTAHNTLLEETWIQKETIAKSGALSIEQYIDGKKHQLLLISKDPRILLEGPQIFFDELDMANQGIVDLIIFNTQGNIDAIATINDEDYYDANLDFSDRKYFQYAILPENKGKVFVGEPIVARVGSLKGNVLIPIATGVYKDDTLIGVVGMGISSSYFMDQFIKPLLTSDQTSVYIINSNSDVIFSSNSSLGGSNLREYAMSGIWEGREEFLSILSRINLSTTGKDKLVWFSPDISQPENRIISYSSLNVGDQKWSIIISSKDSIYENILGRFTRNQTLQLTTTMLFILFTGITFVIGLNIARRDGYDLAYKRLKDFKDKNLKK